MAGSWPPDEGFGVMGCPCWHSGASHSTVQVTSGASASTRRRAATRKSPSRNAASATCSGCATPSNTKASRSPAAGRAATSAGPTPRPSPRSRRPTIWRPATRPTAGPTSTENPGGARAQCAGDYQAGSASPFRITLHRRGIEATLSELGSVCGDAMAQSPSIAKLPQEQWRRMGRSIDETTGRKRVLADRPTIGPPRRRRVSKGRKNSRPAGEPQQRRRVGVSGTRSRRRGFFEDSPETFEAHATSVLTIGRDIWLGAILPFGSCRRQTPRRIFVSALTVHQCDGWCHVQESARPTPKGPREPLSASQSAPEGSPQIERRRWDRLRPLAKAP